MKERGGFAHNRGSVYLIRDRYEHKTNKVISQKDNFYGLSFHGVEKFVIGFCHRHLIDQKFNSIDLIHWM